MPNLDLFRREFEATMIQVRQRLAKLDELAGRLHRQVGAFCAR